MGVNDVQGGGVPKLLLLHGFLSGRAAWVPLQRQLGAVDTVAPDLLGYGTSPRPGRGYSLERMVRELEPLVRAEKPDYVLGHSMGGIVALALAAAMPGAFAGVGVIGLPVYHDRADAMRYLHRRGLLHRILLHTDGLSHLGCVGMHHVRPLWLPFSPLFLPRQPRYVLRSTFDHCRDSHLGSLDQVVFAGHVGKLADRVTTPVMALHGARDRAAPIDRVRELAAREGWELRVAPTGGHQLAVERPRMVAKWVRERLIPLTLRPPSIAMERGSRRWRGSVRRPMSKAGECY